MSPNQIIALVRDAVILAVLGYILWFIHHADMNAAKVADLQGVEKQLQANAVQQEKWQEESRNAEAQRVSELQSVSAAISNNRTPVIVRLPASSGAMSSPSAPTPSGTACTGGSAEGVGVDIRPRLNAFELKYEGILASCRSVLNSWP